MCAALGSPVGHAPDVVHGKPSLISHDGEGLFEDLPESLRVGRYHSLCVDRDDLPEELIETAHTDDEREVVMGVRHREKLHFGVQFHPESILTDDGKQMVDNFVQRCEEASNE
jgi:anthranilate synthase component 2